MSPKRSTLTSLALVGGLTLSCRQPVKPIEVNAVEKRSRPAVSSVPTELDAKLFDDVPGALTAGRRLGFKVFEARLSNGARVIVAPRPDFPSVALSFVLNRGTCDGGVAAWVYAGSLHGPATTQDGYENSSYLYYVATQPHTYATEEAVVMSAEVLSPLLASALSSLAPMFFSPSLESHVITDSRDWVHRHVEREGSYEARWARRVVRTQLFGTRGYGYGAAQGEPADVDAVRDADVRAFRDAALSPERVTVIAVGAVTPEAMKRMLERSIAGLPRLHQARPSTCDVSASSSQRSVIQVLDRPGASQAQVHIGARGVPVGHGDAMALEVLSRAMGNSLSSRLNVGARGTHGVTYGLHMQAESWSAGGVVQLGGAIESGRVASSVEGILRELRRAATEPLDEHELRRARLLAIGDDGAHAEFASELREVATHGLPLTAVNARRSAILATTSEDVMRVAAKYLAPEKLSIAVVGDAATLVPQLVALGIADINVEKQAP